jgi:catalase
VWVVASVAEYTSEVTDDDFVQLRMFWEDVLGKREGQQERQVSNVAAHLGRAKPAVWEAAFGMLRLSCFVPLV